MHGDVLCDSDSGGGDGGGDASGTNFNRCRYDPTRGVPPRDRELLEIDYIFM